MFGMSRASALLFFVLTHLIFEMYFLRAMR